MGEVSGRESHLKTVSPECWSHKPEPLGGVGLRVEKRQPLEWRGAKERQSRQNREQEQMHGSDKQHDMLGSHSSAELLEIKTETDSVRDGLKSGQGGEGA